MIQFLTIIIIQKNNLVTCSIMVSTKLKITLHRDSERMSKLDIPKELTAGKIPDDAKFELERHMQYIIEKYML